MEKSVLKTLIYYDIFDFPLKAWEIHKWLIGNGSLKQVEKTLKSLIQKSKVKSQKDYFFLEEAGKNLVRERIERERVSLAHLRKARFMSSLFKVIPWIKLVGVSGSLAIMGSRGRDDIDLFIITNKNRIWICRLLLIIITSLLGLRRTRREKLLQASGKICINLILEIDNLAQHNRNIYLAHEVLQMKVLWQRDEVYSKFLHDNFWAFKFLPNWKSGIKENQKSKIKNQKYNLKFKSKKYFLNTLESGAKKFQLKIMNSPTGSERIENGALYFHPEDKGVKILEEYRKRISAISITQYTNKPITQ